MDELEVVVGLRGGENLFHRGFKYCKHTRGKKYITWRCSNSMKYSCRGSIATSLPPYTGFSNFKPHSHPPDEMTTKVQQLRLELRKRAANSSEKPNVVMKNLLRDIPPELREKLGKLSTVKRDIRRRRQMATSSSARQTSNANKQDNQYSVGVSDAHPEDYSGEIPGTGNPEQSALVEDSPEQITSEDDLEPSQSEEDNDSSRCENQTSSEPCQSMAVDFQMYPKVSSPFELISNNALVDKTSNDLEKLIVDVANTEMNIERPIEAVPEVVSNMLQSATMRMYECEGPQSQATSKESSRERCSKEDVVMIQALPKDQTVHPLQDSYPAPTLCGPIKTEPCTGGLFVNENYATADCIGNMDSQQQEPLHHITQPKQVGSKEEPSLTSLHAAIFRLESLSGRLEAAVFEDSLDKFGKNLVSLLRGLPWKTIQTLQKKFIADVLEAKGRHESSLKEPSRDGLYSELKNNGTPSMTRTIDPPLKPGKSKTTNKRKYKYNCPELACFMPAPPYSLATSKLPSNGYDFTGLSSTGLAKESLSMPAPPCGLATSKLPSNGYDFAGLSSGLAKESLFMSAPPYGLATSKLPSNGYDFTGLSPGLAKESLSMPAPPCGLATSKLPSNGYDFTGLSLGLAKESLLAPENHSQFDEQEEPEIEECKFEVVLCDGMAQVKEEPDCEESSAETTAAAEEVSRVVAATTDPNLLGYMCSLCNAHCFSVIDLKRHYSLEHLGKRTTPETKTTDEPEDNAKRKCTGLNSSSSSFSNTQNLKSASEEQNTRLTPL